MGVTYNNRIVTDGLVLCLDAASKRSYPGTGTTWTDLKGGNNGTLTNGPTFDTGNGGSIVFDGTNDFSQSYPFNGDFSSNSYTITCWGKSYTSASRTTYFGFRSSGNDWAYNHLCFMTWNTSFSPYSMMLFVGNGSTYQNAPVDSSGIFSNKKVTEWNFITITITPTTVYLYLNDDQFYDWSSIISYRASFDRFWVGTRGNAYFNGNISNVSIYNRALSADEIRRNYLSTKERYL